MDRAFTLRVAPEAVWPWLVQLGKNRAGWYLPRTVERLVPPSRRGHTDVTWVLVLAPEQTEVGPGTRVHLRLRLGPVRHVLLAERLGGAFDLLTVAGLAAGLRERVERP